MDNRKLKTGVAYHGNRMPSHYREDLKEIVRADMDIVVHMFSHTDWDRHKTVMGDIFKMTEDAGMEVWVDNWGLGGPPGDKSHFLAYHPESHIIYSNGEMAPVNACLNSPDFRAFVKEWIDTVYALGGRTIFWDECMVVAVKLAAKNLKPVITSRCPLFWTRMRPISAPKPLWTTLKRSRHIPLRSASGMWSA